RARPAGPRHDGGGRRCLMSDGADELAGKDEDETGAENGAETADPGFRKLLDKLHLEHNFDLRQYKEGSLLRRVRRRMSQVRVDGLENYLRLLDRNHEEDRKSTRLNSSH